MKLPVLRAFALLLPCAALLGCSEGTSFTISGKVTQDGTPVGGAEVRFFPNANLKQSDFVDKTNDDGTFEIKVPGSQKFTNGQFIATVTKYVARKGGKVATEGLDSEQLKRMGLADNVLNPKYADAARSDQKFDIQRHDTTVEIKLKK